MGPVAPASPIVHRYLTARPRDLLNVQRISLVETQSKVALRTSHVLLVSATALEKLRVCRYRNRVGRWLLALTSILSNARTALVYRKSDSALNYSTH